MEENINQLAEEQQVGNQAETTTAEATPVETESATEPTPAPQPAKPEKSYNKQEMNEIVSKRIKKFYDDFGVQNNDELKELVGKAQGFEETQRQLEEAKKELQELKNDILLKESGIGSKYVDLAKLYLSSKSLEVNGDNIKQILKDYPEWADKPKQPEAPIQFGANNTNTKPQKSNKEIVEELFGKLGG